jgi:hypothetical protein
MHILDRLKHLFPDAKVIVGIRERRRWLRSCYYRYVISGGKLKFNDYMIEYQKGILDVPDYLQEVDKRFRSVFVYHHEDLVKKRKETIEKICDFIGCKVPKYKVVRRNVSLSDSQLNFVRWLNKFRIGKYFMEVIKRLRRTPT